MTADELSLIRATFARLKRHKTNFGRLFYDRLFAIAPDARPLFKGNLDELDSRSTRKSSGKMAACRMRR